MSSAEAPLPTVGPIRRLAFVNDYHPIVYSVFPRNHAGGGFAAVTQDIPRIAELGVDYLWLMPFYPVGRTGRKGPAGSPYAIRDHRAVDPELGTVDQLIRLIDTAHRNGLGVLADIVFNHTAPDSTIADAHPQWLLRDANGAPAPRIDDWSDVVDVDYSAPGLAEHQIGTMAHWLGVGFDGFRADVAAMVPMWFWQRAREELDARFGHTFWLAESTDAPFQEELSRLGIEYADDQALLRAFDLCYDYATHPAFKALHAGTITIDTYLAAKLQTGEHRVANFMENHDHRRAASLMDGTLLPAWHAFTLLHPGGALLYAGGEFGHVTAPSLFERDPVIMKTQDGGAKTVTPELIRTLVRLRRDAERRGKVSVVHRGGGVVEISWGRGRPTTVVLDLAGTGRDADASPSDGGRIVAIAPGVTLVTRPEARPEARA